MVEMLWLYVMEHVISAAGAGLVLVTMAIMHDVRKRYPMPHWRGGMSPLKPATVDPLDIGCILSSTMLVVFLVAWYYYVKLGLG